MSPDPYLKPEDSDPNYTLDREEPRMADKTQPIRGPAGVTNLLALLVDVGFYATPPGVRPRPRQPGVCGHESPQRHDEGVFDHFTRDVTEVVTRTGLGSEFDRRHPGEVAVAFREKQLLGHPLLEDVEGESGTRPWRPFVENAPDDGFIPAHDVSALGCSPLDLGESSPHQQFASLARERLEREPGLDAGQERG